MVAEGIPDAGNHYGVKHIHTTDDLVVLISSVAAFGERQPQGKHPLPLIVLPLELHT